MPWGKGFAPIQNQSFLEASFLEKIREEDNVHQNYRRTHRDDAKRHVLPAQVSGEL